ncbi:MAG: HAD family phosphatase [Vicinamibacteraceae bacterium]
MAALRPTVVVFDLGGVLVDWNPRYLYRQLFDGDDVAMERFLDEVCTPAWNDEQDRGRPFADACALLVREHPERRALIEAWPLRYEETMAGPVAGTVEVLAELRARKVPLYALSNWSAETFPHARARFPFLQWFRAIVLSGELRIAKPDPAIYQYLLDTYRLRAEDLVFIDDAPRNVAAAAALGIRAVQFTDAAALRRALVDLGLLEAGATDSTS